MWTVLYGLMGYAAHRAWVAGVHSPSPDTVALTKVSTGMFLDLGERGKEGEGVDG